MPFISEFNYRWLDDGRNMQLLNDVIYVDKYKQKYIVPEGEITDGASIPRILWVLASGPFEGPYRNAAVLHDYLYRMGRDLKKPIVNKKRADELFYEAMIECGVSKLEALTKFYAVKWFAPHW